MTNYVLKIGALFILFILSLSSKIVHAQSIGIGTVSPNSDLAILHIDIPDKENKPQGIIIPKLSTLQIGKIPVITGDLESDGLLVFDINSHLIKYFDSDKGAWRSLDTAVNKISSYWELNDNGNLNYPKAIGIGTANPNNMLEVAGTGKFEKLIITEGAKANYVLTSDEDGVASWKEQTTVSSDNLGNHTATTDIDLNQNEIHNVQSIEVNEIFKQSESLNQLPYAYGNVTQSDNIGLIPSSSITMSSNNFTVFDVANVSKEGWFRITLFDTDGNKIDNLNEKEIILQATAYNSNDDQTYPTIINYHVDEDNSVVIIHTFGFDEGELKPLDMNFSFMLWYHPL